MLSLNLDMATLFDNINTWFNALWPIAVVTIAIPFGLGLITYISNAVVKGFRGR